MNYDLSIEGNNEQKKKVRKDAQMCADEIDRN